MTQHLARRRTPSEEQPRLTPGGAIEIPLSEAELAALERKDRLAEERIAQRREDREREAAERAAREAGAGERWRLERPRVGDAVTDRL